MAKHVLSMTYPPKIDAVQAGMCTQTIRGKWKIKVGDSILFHGWTDPKKPYRSPWNDQMRVTVTEVIPIMIDSFLGIGTRKPIINLIDWHAWNDDCVNDLAKRDYIDPPTGLALRDVLFKLNGAPDAPEKYQIIRWKVDWGATIQIRNEKNRIKLLEEGEQ